MKTATYLIHAKRPGEPDSAYRVIERSKGPIADDDALARFEALVELRPHLELRLTRDGQVVCEWER